MKHLLTQRNNSDNSFEQFVFWFEEAPKYRTIAMGRGEYYLPFPYVLHRVKLFSIWQTTNYPSYSHDVFLRNESTSAQDIIKNGFSYWIPYLPNFSSTLYCRGTLADDVQYQLNAKYQNRSDEEKLNNGYKISRMIIHGFWNSKFLSSEWSTLSYYRKTRSQMKQLKPEDLPLMMVDSKSSRYSPNELLVSC